MTTPSNCSTTVSDLSGNTQQGDTVTVTFTVPSGMNDQLTLVSYYAPSPSWSDSNAYQQLIYQQQGATGIRRILGMHSLIKKYGAAAVEDACATALDIGVYEYRFVRRYLERRPHPQMFLRQIDPLIRELTEYRDFINLKIKEQPE